MGDLRVGGIVKQKVSKVSKVLTRKNFITKVYKAVRYSKTLNFSKSTDQMNLPECLMPAWPLSRCIERCRDILIGSKIEVGVEVKVEVEVA